LHESGKNRLADSVNFIQAALQQQAVIILADLRGMGETEDRSELNDPKYYNREYRNAMLALHIGRPLIGQRVSDIQTLLQFISASPRFKSLPLEVNAYGAAAIPALHAALFDETLNTLTLYAPLGSFQDILKDPVARNWYSYVIPGVLNYYDIPDLIKLLGSKKISIVEYASETRTW